MRVRVRYTKSGKLRFVSAIDLGRVWERSLRRADLPIAYSEGFTPHPKVSFPDALTLGYASTGEYAELTFAAPIALQPAIAALNAALPDGMRIVDAHAVTEGAPRLAKWLQASVWDLAYPAAGAVDLDAAAAQLLGADLLMVDRDRKGVVTRLDLRPALHTLVHQDGTVRAALHHVEPPMRPREVHLALQARVGGALSEPVLVTRVAQGRPTEDGVIEAISGRLEPPHPRTTHQKANTP